jgi:flavodoxin
MEKNTAHNFIAIFASTSGNVAAVVNKVAEVLQSTGATVTSYRSETASVDLLQQDAIFILATSTWEHGMLNPYFVDFLTQMSELDLHGKRAIFIGLGDRRYEPVLFAEGIEIVRRKFLELGGEQVYETLKIDGEPQELLDSVVTEWANKLVETLK